MPAALLSFSAPSHTSFAGPIYGGWQRKAVKLGARSVSCASPLESVTLSDTYGQIGSPFGLSTAATLRFASSKQQRLRFSESRSTLLQPRTNRTSGPEQSNPDCGASDTGYPSNLIDGHPVQLMLKQSALTGPAKAQDPTDVNRGDVLPKTALNLHERLRESFPPQLAAEQIQRNSVDPAAHRTLTTKLMQMLPSANPGFLRQFLCMALRYSTAYQKTSCSLES